jgi:hypothetical protein
LGQFVIWQFTWWSFFPNLLTFPPLIPECFDPGIIISQLHNFHLVLFNSFELFSFKYLNTFYNSYIKAYLFANYIIHATSGSIFTDQFFYCLWGMFSCIFACLIFDWMLDTVYTLECLWCIVNIRLYSGRQLIYF